MTSEKIFDWEEASKIHCAEQVALYRELCNEKVDIDEFIFQLIDLRHKLGKSCQPSYAKSQYRRLKDHFGFFTGKKIV